MKKKWNEDTEREWSTPEKYVCAVCIVDEFLKGIIEEHLVKTECSYCGRIGDIPISANLDEILPFIAGTFLEYIQDPCTIDFPREFGKWIFEECIKNTAEALLSIDLLPFKGELFDDICNSFNGEEWVFAPNGCWWGNHEYEQLQNSWEGFVKRTKHTSRFFFTTNNDDNTLPGAVHILKVIGDFIEQFSLFLELPKDQVLYRARKVPCGTKLTSFDELGPPPQSKTVAGRMNPTGISYGYFTLNDVTAILEVSEGPPSTLSLAKFSLKEPLLAVNLTDLPSIPSIYDFERKMERDSLEFLRSFVKDISKPVSKDGSEHVEYVPSQIVSEYISQVLSAQIGKTVGALVYPSAVDTGGTNIVIFPQRYYGHILMWKDVIELLKVIKFDLMNWQAYGDLTTKTTSLL